MTDLTPEFCPHCLVDFKDGTTEIKPSGIPKCGRCLLPLWWEDRSGKVKDRAWPSCVELSASRERTKVAPEGMRRAEEERNDALALLSQFKNAVRSFRETADELEDISRKVRDL